MVNNHIRVLHDNAIDEYKRQRKNVENLCKMGLISWEAIYFFDEQIADLKYNHAITVHKSLETGSYKTYLIDWNLLRALHTQ